MKRLSLFFLLLASSLSAQVNSARMLSGVNAVTGASYTIVAADSTRVTTFSNASPVAVSLPSGATLNFGAGAVFSAKNIGVGTVTITCASCTINATGTAASTLNLATGQNVDLYSDGANYTAFVAPAAPTSSGTAAGPGQIGRFWYQYGDASGISCVPVGNNSCIGFGTQSGLAATATETQGRQMSATAAGSANTVIGLESGCGANFGQAAMSWGTTTRWGMRIMTQVTSTARYWVGLSDCRAGDFSAGAANNATDTPNLNYCAFRFSSTTDTTWKAVCATSSANQTVVDTGIAPATATSTMFEIIPGTGGTSAVFFLNGVQVATVSTNLMANSQLIGTFFTVDNKNTATAEAITFYWGQVLFTK